MSKFDKIFDKTIDKALDFYLDHKDWIQAYTITTSFCFHILIVLWVIFS